MSTPVEISWLLTAVGKGNATAFESLYSATCAKLYGVVLRILRRHDLAADVVEQAYLQIWRRAGEFNPGCFSKPRHDFDDSALVHPAQMRGRRH